MYHLNLFLALTALTFGATGLALPLSGTLATQPCEFQEVKRNQSTVFGWQIAGTALNTAETGAICNDLPCTRLANAGLDVLSIKAPSCSASNSEINATSALPKIVQHSSAAFETMLTNAFPQDNEIDFRYLCDNIRFVQLRSFMLNDAQIINATCNKGGPGAQISPQPFTSIAKPNETAVAAYKDIASKLFAHNYAATASSKKQLQNFCESAPSYQSNFEDLQLDPQTVSWELCSIERIPTASQAQASIKKYTSQQFITVVENMSNVAGWNKWLCEQLDQDAMDRTGLDGEMIKSQVCGLVEDSS